MSDVFTPPPSIRPGGSFLIAWQLRDKRVLLVGGGVVAAGRLTNILEADALVTLICPVAGMSPEVYYRVFEDEYSKMRIIHYDRPWEGESDLALDGGVDMVLTAVDDSATSRDICLAARQKRIPVNVADVPPECDFYFGSQIRNGPLQVLVSTGGRGPKIANIVRRRIEESLPNNVGRAIERVGELRKRLRHRAPGTGGELSKKRMEWMIGVCEEWQLDELGALTDPIMEKLLNEGWEKGIILTPEQAGLRRPRKPRRPRFSTPAIDRMLMPVVGALVGVTVTLFMFRRSWKI